MNNKDEKSPQEEKQQLLYIFVAIFMASQGANFFLEHNFPLGAVVLMAILSGLAITFVKPKENDHFVLSRWGLVILVVAGWIWYALDKFQII